MKKPVILHTEVSNGWGGQEIRILNEMLGIKERGYEVLLATPGDTAIFGRARMAGIETFDVKMDKYGFWEGVTKLRSVIKANSVSIVNTHSSRDSWMGSIAGRLTGVKVIRTRHISSELNKNVMTRLVYGPLCDAVITTGEFIKGQVVEGLGIRPGKVYSIPTGIDIGKFMNARGDLVRASLDIEDSDVVVGMASVLRSWKGHEYIVRAIREVVDEFPNVKLVLAGDGPWMPTLEIWVREFRLEGKMLLLGHRDDIAEVIQSFDISVLPSYASEGIPQFILQSMAAGKPVIGTTVGGIPEVVHDGITGFLVPPKDPAAIASAIRSLIADPEKMKAMGEAGRRLVIERHTAGAMLDALESLYAKVLA
jgi:glycosyltransferase involved in cell wall biosynthesis